jgi:hypothetical protein
VKPIRITGSSDAVMADKINELLRKFEYPDADTIAPAFQGGGGGGMAHVLIVSQSEPDFVQAKADFVVTETGAGSQLNAIFASLPAGKWSIWMAGRFNVEEDIDFPDGAWVRGLGYTSAGYGGG